MEYVEIARAESERGELVLRQRHEEGAPSALELRANGVFVMDTQETSTEQALADAALELVEDPRDVLVGGLGLGYTMHRVLADSRVERCSVVEIEPALVDWMRDGTIPHGPALLADERANPVVADIAAAVGEAADASYDLVLLDVDNGPGLPGPRRQRGALRTAVPHRRTPVAAARRRRRDLVGRRLAGARGDPARGVRRRRDPAVRRPAAGAGRAVLAPCRPGADAGSLGRVSTRQPTAGEYRTEHDSLGEIQVPADALWRAQTQRAVENFPISGSRLEPRHIRALALVKAAAARVNGELGVITAEQAGAITAAAGRIADGEHADQFPLDVFQTGSGTSSNMNMNEVIAGLAAADGADVHPNDHVNASQSSNDTFPTSIHVAATLAVVDDLLPALTTLEASLAAKAEEFAGLVKSGRTHLMDATPVMLGQEFGGYAATVRYAGERLAAVLPRVRELPLGGTAVGTGINTPAGFAAKVIEELSGATGQEFTEARDHFEAQGTRDSLVELSGVLRTIAVGLTKICNDLRWMASGPTTGLSEIRLPDLQPGSSIMPGKVNPVLPEATLQVCAQVVGNDATVAWAGASGNFELNVMLPVIARNLLESIRLLSTSSVLLAERCVDGITADAERMRAYAASSPSVVTPLNKYVGYENAAKIAKQALADGATIRETVIAMGYVERGELTEEQLDEALDLEGMTRGS